ncbi:MAG: tyrosine-type recombinase/integrase, partial [Caulobacterales bacterium]|nr:tyrosine-type recombinase/integrase [Caulobacterales bacterium]
MALTDSAIKAAKSKDKPYKMYDGGGLFVLISQNSSKLWRLKFKFLDKEKLLSLGTYPEIGLKDARIRRDEAKTQLANGIDPAFDKKQKQQQAKQQAADSLKVISEEFLEKLEKDGLAEATMVKNHYLAKHLYQDLGNRPVSKIEPYEVLAVLKKIERRGKVETAHRVCSFAARLFRYAIVTGRAKFNPAADLSEGLVVPQVKHRAAIPDRKEVGALLRAIADYSGHYTTKQALRLIPYVFVRPGELRHAEWAEIDFKEKLWKIPAAKMKMREDFVLPLPPQAIEILEETKAVASNSKYVFPSLRSGSRPMSENTINGALRRMGYDKDTMSGHGFRSIASTFLNESGKWSS